MPAVFAPFCVASSDKWLLMWHHFHSKMVIIWAFSQTNWFNFTRISTILHHLTTQSQYDVLLHKMEIVLRPYIAVTSLHPVYIQLCVLSLRQNCQSSRRPLSSSEGLPDGRQFLQRHSPNNHYLIFQWRDEWKSAPVVNSSPVDDPAIRQLAGFDISRRDWGKKSDVSATDRMSQTIRKAVDPY